MYYLDTNLLSAMVKAKRANKSLQKTAKIIGNISSATLSRVENGKIPAIETFLLLCDWLQVLPADFIKNTQQRQLQPLLNLNTAKKIEILLKSDSSLNLQMSNALITLVNKILDTNIELS